MVIGDGPEPVVARRVRDAVPDPAVLVAHVDPVAATPTHTLATDVAILPHRVEDDAVRRFLAASNASNAILVLFHAHVPLQAAFDAVNAVVPVVGAIAVPCCDMHPRQALLNSAPPKWEFADDAIESRERLVRIWAP